MGVAVVSARGVPGSSTARNFTQRYHAGPNRPTRPTHLAEIWSVRSQATR